MITTTLMGIISLPVVASAQSTGSQAISVGTACAGVTGVGGLANKASGYLSSKIQGSILGGGAVPTSNRSLESTASELTVFQTNIKGLEDCLIYGGGQILLNNMTESTIKWIKGGYNGPPLYAVDPNKLFLDLADAVTGGLAREIRSIEMCNFTGTGKQFQNDLANSLELSTRSNASSKFADQLRCPFSSVADPRLCNYPPEVRANLDKLDARALAFYQNLYCKQINPEQAAGAFYRDFRNGGWRAMESTLSDSGNPLGTVIQASRELGERTDQAVKTEEQKLGWNSGFLNVPDESKCNYPGNLGALIGASELLDQEGGTGTMTDYIPSGARALYKQQYCETLTPGKAVETELSKTLGVKLDRVGFADSLSKIFNAFVDQLTKDATDSAKGLFR